MNQPLKNICVKLLQGYFLREQKYRGKIIYMLFDAEINPIEKLRRNPISAINRHVNEKYELWKKDVKGDYYFSIKSVRSMHGNSTLKRLYKLRLKAELPLVGQIYPKRKSTLKREKEIEIENKTISLF